MGALVVNDDKIDLPRTHSDEPCHPPQRCQLRVFRAFQHSDPEYLKDHMRGNDRDEGFDIGRNPERGLFILPETSSGLELVDILTNATRRAMLGNLGESGWRDIRDLIVTKDRQTISLFGSTTPPTNKPKYLRVLAHFAHGGKAMLR